MSLKILLLTTLTVAGLASWRRLVVTRPRVTKRPLPRKAHMEAAIVGAQAFAQSALPFIDNLRPGNLVLQECITSATNMSLSVELYLKALLLLSGKWPPRTHDLLRLYKALPRALRVELARKCRAIPKGPNVDAFIYLDMPPVGAPPGKLPTSSPLGEPLDGLPALLRRSKNAFLVWRYFYEVLHEDKPASTSYAFLGLTMAANLFAQEATVMFADWDRAHGKASGPLTP